MKIIPVSVGDIRIKRAIALLLLLAQRRYARLEAEHLLAMPRETMRRSDRIRALGFLAPPLVFLYVLIGKGCALDGWAGWYYVLQRTLAECLIALEIIDRRLRK